MNNLLGMNFGSILQTFWTTLVDNLMLAQYVWAICFAILGITISVLAKRFTRMIRKNNNISSEDTVLITIKAIGLGFIFIALLLIVLSHFV